MLGDRLSPAHVPDDLDCGRGNGRRCARGQAKQCREPIAEIVREKDRANYCDYFTPRAGAYSTKSETEASAAKAQLDALFGGSTPATSAADEARKKLDELFKKP